MLHTFHINHWESDSYCQYDIILSYHHIASSRKLSWRVSTTFASDLVCDAAETERSRWCADRRKHRTRSWLAGRPKLSFLGRETGKNWHAKDKWKPFTPGIYGMLQHVITSLVLNENPFCQIYKLYKILLCNTFLEGQRIFPVIHKSWEGYWDGNRTSVFLGHRASELIKIDQPGLRMHSIRQRLEVDRSGADLPDTQGTHFSSTNDHQRPC